MASDLGQIVGQVLYDQQMDGNVSNDQAVIGGTVQLFRDNGNGAFSLAGDTLQTSTVTNSAGRYVFGNLTAGSYFVKVVSPITGQTLANDGVSSIITISAAEAQGSVNLMIDEFSGVQTVSATRLANDVGSKSNSVADGANSKPGGVRDLYAQVSANVGSITLESGFLGTSLINVQSTSAARGIARVVWDGADGNGTAVNRNGMNLNMNADGINSGIMISVAADNKPNATVTVRLSSDEGRISTATTTIIDQDGMIDGDVGEQIFIPWSAFTPITGSVGGANLSDIGSVELEFDFSNGQSDGLDVVASLVGVIGQTVKSADFSITPKLRLGDLVWLDRNNDGMYMPGETVKPGVTLNLYRDTNKSGSYEQAVDEFLASTVTDSGGRYLFDNLMPGDYIVQVPEAMFAANAALNGYFTSTGNNENGMAPDPDADTDNKDKGTRVEGQGVVSKAITLTGFGEPVNDGDQDSNSNLTVDFGFYCIDLVVDKSVDLTTVNAGGTLTYTIVLTNNGTSRATGVGMEDNLPAGLTYTGSAGTTAPSVISGQKLTYYLGDFEPGQSRTFTITASVASTATGTLKNTVAVAAIEQEATLANNMDMVTTTIAARVIPITPLETPTRLSKRRFLSVVRT